MACMTSKYTKIQTKEKKVVLLLSRSPSKRFLLIGCYLLLQIVQGTINYEVNLKLFFFQNNWVDLFCTVYAVVL